MLFKHIAFFRKAPSIYFDHDKIKIGYRTGDDLNYFYEKYINCSRAETKIYVIGNTSKQHACRIPNHWA